MSEMNLKQIEDKLNEEFASEFRKLVFWYDGAAEFEDEIDSINLQNAKVLRLGRDNQFYIKYHIECENTKDNFLIYAPFDKPQGKDNHLADTLRYSKEFFADRASLIMLELGCTEKVKPYIKSHSKFFAAKERLSKLTDFEIERYTEGMLSVAMMSVIAKSKTASFDEVMRAILTDEDIEDNRYLSEFRKYDLTDDFWKQVELNFGYQDSEPTIEKLILTMFATYAAKTVKCDLPQSLRKFVSYKAGNVIAFLDNLMNNYIYGESFDRISDLAFRMLKGETEFSKMPVEDISECYIFRGVDSIIIKWITERLRAEDTAATLLQKSIPEICKIRRKQHFGIKQKSEYFVLENAWYLLSAGSYTSIAGLDRVAKSYTEKGFYLDRRYRYFYFYYDKLEDNTAFEDLRQLVENVYTNEYLNKIAVNWTNEFTVDVDDTRLTRQQSFYSSIIAPQKERTVVIISDALRYEVGYSLFEKLQADEKCTVSIEPMLSVLPSYTRLGMAALLPHRSLGFNENYDVLIDGKTADDLKGRQAILQGYCENSRCIQYDELKTMNIAGLREVFTGQNVVYVYHNQIDARGDKQATENEVFSACEEAIDEIYSLIKRLSTSANTVHFIVTADHGFIYKRDKLTESDKISKVSSAGAFTGKRYYVSESAVEADGVVSVPLSSALTNDDNRIVSFPIASDIFKTAGGGCNYVHGGCSPQEMLIPVIDVKTEKGKKETANATISLISIAGKITNLITTLDFIQTEPVSDVIKETTYRIYFVSSDNEKISNEHIYVADKTDVEAPKRMFNLRFSFKEKKYDKAKKYYLVAIDDKTGVEVLRHETIMDIAFANDFGFDI